MKDIGEKLKAKRLQSGLDISEVAMDLKLKTRQIEYVEDGDRDKFKDVFEFKSILSNYAKYLGLDSEEIIDEFNEYMFDSTSRISVEEIEEALKKDNTKVMSPYTKVRKYDKKFIIYACMCGLLIVIVFIFCLIVR